MKARSSVGERFLDTEEVAGSIPVVPTIKTVFGRQLSAKKPKAER